MSNVPGMVSKIVEGLGDRHRAGRMSMDWMFFGPDAMTRCVN
jgi:hypothetical protein